MLSNGANLAVLLGMRTEAVFIIIVFQNRGLFPEDESNYNRVYWHTVGTSQEEDVLIYEDTEDKEFSFNPSLSDDYRYLILSVWKGTENKSRIYYRD